MKNSNRSREGNPSLSGTSHMKPGKPVIGPATPAARIPADAPSTPLTVTIDPVTRIEGHLKIKAKLDYVGGDLQVVDAWSTGTLFRGFEKILENRDPWDAGPITQRICGVCPVSHGLAAVKAMDAASGVVIPENARVLRNLVLAANYISSHILHFYHLSALDYVQGPAMGPWEPAWKVDFRFDPATTQVLNDHYLEALAMRRKAHEAGAVFGGRLPAPPAYIPGGFTSHPKAAKITAVTNLLNELIPFIQNIYIPDVQLLGTVYSDYNTIGQGHGHLLSFGVFDQDNTGLVKLLEQGRAVGGATQIDTVNVGQITEDVTYSWYDDSTNHLTPDSGETVPQHPKGGAYSWLKAPRYGDLPYEVGPLARMWVNGDYQNGISVVDRHMARALETLKVAQAMQTWLTELNPGQPVFQPNTVPTSATAFGLTEAPRGALGHWLKISNKKIASYQVVTPTCWNASPRDTSGVRGPIEESIMGTPVKNVTKPIELLRVVHSFDPCMACSVHVSRPDSRDEVVLLSRWG